ncbi:MAG: endonuclease/exonuclease/phosphatase family protein [Deltaproteobacteria bacterium]|nr:endonuclease/exonuclease/phosphatase family protein [Deltaproteobacteria bacterium]
MCPLWMLVDPWRRLAVVFLLFVVGCTNRSDGPGEGPVEDASARAGDAGIDVVLPPARTDFVPRVGDDERIDIATWNVRNFPATADTPRLVADIIASLDLDLVAVQEIASVSAFEELLARLPEHEGVLSPHQYSDGTYQKLGLLYRRGLIEVTEVGVLFDGSWNEFPRSPLRATISVNDGVHPRFDFTAIVVHLKAGLDRQDIERRTSAFRLLETHVRGLVDGPGDDDVVVLGDFNEVLTRASGLAVFAPWLDASDRYAVQTKSLASENKVTYLPARVMLDHLITTASLLDEVGARPAVIPPLHAQVQGYEAVISDHLPVVLSMSVK